jgi:CspA family cold shock protein
MTSKGTVKKFDSVRGYGFITGDDDIDIFVHQSFIQMDGFRTLEVGQTVTYDLEKSDKGLKAVNVFVIYED